MPSARKPPPAAPRRPAHRPEFEPTAQQRQLVKLMVAGGIQHEKIVSVLGITRNTFRKHFRREIANASAEADAQVVAALFNMATKDKNVAAAIWWTKTRMRWSERIVVADGSEGDLDPASLSDEQIAQRIEKLRRNAAVVRAANSGKVVH